MKKHLLFSLFAIAGFMVSWGQTTFTTVPPLNGGNGSGGTAFNLETNQAIVITEFLAALQSTSNNIQIWMNQTPVAGPPNITTANGWTMIHSATLTGQSVGLTPVLSTIPLSAPLTLNPGTYGFYIGNSSGSSVVYTTWNTSLPAAITDGTVTFHVGTNNGYGGSIPSPTFHPRGFNGGITYQPASTAPNDAGIASIESPSVYCVGDSALLTVKVQNYGTMPLDSCEVHWDINGVSSSQWYVVSLDTFGGTGATDTIITLDTLVMGSGVTNIMAYTEWPNFFPDTVNSNDTAYAALQPALNGTYSIDASGAGDYQSITDAEAALDMFGVCGPVVFEVASDTYNEQVEFGSYTGVDATNTIVFRSEAGSADSVLWTFSGSTSSANNYVAKFSGSEYISFEDLTIWNASTSFSYGRVIEMSSSNDISFMDNVIKGNASTTTSTFKAVVYVNSADMENITFDHNTIEGGSYGIYWFGNFSSYTRNLIVNGNMFYNNYYRYAYFYYQENMQLTGNEFYHDGTPYTFTSYGVYMVYNIGDNVNINDNYMHSNNGFPTYGMYLNQINGDFFRMASIANNRMIIGDSLSSATNYGMYILNNLFAQYVNNSITILPAGNTNSRCIFANSGSVNFAYNNILANYGSGYAMYAQNGNIFTEMDNNAFHSNGANLNYLSGGHADLAAWTSATGYDSNSVEVSMPFIDINTLKVCNDTLDGAGQPNALVMYDYEGEPRDMNTPDIGADEFMAVSAFTLGADLTLCDGDTIDYEVFYFDTVVWNGVDTNNYIQITNPSNYTVEVSGVCGTATDTLQVLAQIKATLPTTENICSDGNTVLDPGVGNGTYTWNDGSTDSTLMVDMPGTYSVYVIDEHGCESSDTATITQSVAVDLDETADLCEGDVIFLDAVLQGSYTWSDGSTNQILQVSSGGTYSVTVTDNFGCITADTTVVTEVPNAVADWDTASVSFFTVTFANASTGATTYAWDFGDGSTSTDENPTHIYSNTWYDTCYTVTLTVTGDCGTDTYMDTVCVGEVLSVEDGVRNEDQISMYPNPTEGIVNVVVATSGKELSIEVVDIQGRQIFARDYGQASGLVQNELDLSGVAKGVYMVKVTLDDQTTVERVTVR